MSHPGNDQVLDQIRDEISEMDRADKVHFCRDYYGLDTVNNMSEDEMEEKISEIKFDQWPDGPA